MLNKNYESVFEFAQSNVLDIARNESAWKAYLEAASRLYKYSFKDSLLIYAQRPDATACADYDIWNKKMNRRINRGAKGIALIDDSGEQLRLRYVFDVSDTTSPENEVPKAWDIREQDREEIITALSDYFKIETNTNSAFYNNLLDIVNGAVETGVEEYYDKMISVCEGSSFAALNEIDRKAYFEAALKKSVSFMVLSRTGIGEEYGDNFDNLRYFNTCETITQLGTATQKLSENILRQIEKTIKIINKKEREHENEIKLFGERRSDDTQLHVGDGISHRQVRHASQNLSEREQGGDLQQLSINWQAEQPFEGDRPTGTYEVRPAYPERSSERPAAENGQYDDTYSAPESDSAERGGSSTTGDSLQLGLLNEAISSNDEINIEPKPVGFEVGSEIKIYGKRYAVVEIRENDDPESTVILEDLDADDNEQRYTIETVDFVRWSLAQKEKYSSKEVSPIESLHEQKSPIKSSASDVTPAKNFRITDDTLGSGGAKAKFKSNVDAIRTLNAIEAEGRLATPVEQEILAKYVGWGGLSQAFDESHEQWQKEYTELKQLLSSEEYSSARASTLNAHYTSPVVIKAMFDALENMGFNRGNILEPSCGIGNFFGVLPESMNGSKLYGVELDPVTGRLAKQLYQTADIKIQGFETTDFPDNFFDVAIGNVPFGSYKLSDTKYDKNNFLIHDYFFAKSLDKVRAGGIVAFVTSKGTLDKQNKEVRKYIAQRAELLGAIRLPNTAFKANAGTEVTSDIIFLKKRERVIDVEPDWIHLGVTADGIPVNSYFVDNPDMVLGTMTYEDSMYGNEKNTTCAPFENADLAEQLKEVIPNIIGSITFDEPSYEEQIGGTSILADPNVRNFSFTIFEGEVYYRENSLMHRMALNKTAEGRVRGLVGLRDATRQVIDLQLNNASESDIKASQANLNALYERFTKQYGLINSRANNIAFSDDNSYCLLCSLEILDDDGSLNRKSDIFYKRTIRQHVAVTSVDTAVEALTVSISEKARVDLEFMSGLLSCKEPTEIIKELEGIIFKNPAWGTTNDTSDWETADEYLSGNVRAKLKIARLVAEENPDLFAVNVAALEKVQPKDLDASEIDVRIGATWIEPEYINDFIYELLKPPFYLRDSIKVNYSSFDATWHIDGKTWDPSNVTSNVTYGTTRANAYRLIEDSLNLKDIRIYDTVENPDGTKKQVLNKEQTMFAQQKQQLIKDAFKEWIFKDADRREKLVRKYNDKFNSIRTREYNGDYITFVGMNPEISLKKHQIDAVARILYGGNTLLAHEVGAGKTFEMIAAAMELKRLGLAQKNLIVVPSHLTEQWASEFLRLYPAANILTATKKDFETNRRKKFCSRISTGDYDAVIIGHSQFEKIPLSKERQKDMINNQIGEIVEGIQALKYKRGERLTIKQMEKSKKSLEAKLQQLNDDTKKDDVVTFEELGVDNIFVDEAHYFKNLFLYTKMNNVAGISQTEAKKSSDLFMKTQYLNEKQKNRGVVFATGTPISNSMTELYTVQRYLQYSALREQGLEHFDCWASTFGETQTAIELAPEGTGYRAKTRFSKFYNIPELMTLFKEVADIKTADMLDLPVPAIRGEKPTNVVTKPSDIQIEMVNSLAERAEQVRKGTVDSSIDNMLKITNDGRLLALDQRCVNSMLPDEPNSKVNKCVENIYSIWYDGQDKKLTQLVFCDLSTPKKNGEFSVYEDLKKKLLALGMPEAEVAFIHDAKTDIQKDELFAKVRKGEVRVLVGSTFKMGAGTNVQDKLVALHHLDVPWRPSDVEQREGRIIRQGNSNEEVEIFRYVTENTFDAYSWQLIENKQKFISQIITSKSPVRGAEDIDETALSYAEIKALATGNPLIKEKMDLDIDVARLKLLKANYTSQKYRLEDELIRYYPKEIKTTQEIISGLKADISLYEKNKLSDFSMAIQNRVYVDKKEAGEALLKMTEFAKANLSVEVGSYKGFKLSILYDTFNRDYTLKLKNELQYTIPMGGDEMGNITRLDNAFNNLPERLNKNVEELKNLEQQKIDAAVEIDKPFKYEQELIEKTARLAELNISLSMDDGSVKNEDLQNADDVDGKTAEDKQTETITPDTVSNDNDSQNESTSCPEGGFYSMDNWKSKIDQERANKADSENNNRYNPLDRENYR